VNFSIPIPGFPDTSFTGTLDGLCTDPYGRLWIKEYKTAAQVNTEKLDTDPQITAYYLAATQHLSQLLQRPTEIEGVIYFQFAKRIPQPPRLLVNGEFSQAQNQKTTHSLYKTSLLARFGNVPRRYVRFLNSLLDMETPNGDKFIRVDLVRRNENHIRSEVGKLIAETEEMLNPDLPIYPNPTQDCSWQCGFKQACLALDEGQDVQWMLDETYRRREPHEDRISWLNQIASPEPPERGL
jgi:hypothetical protein